MHVCVCGGGGGGVEERYTSSRLQISISDNVLVRQALELASNPYLKKIEAEVIMSQPSSFYHSSRKGIRNTALQLLDLCRPY